MKMKRKIEGPLLIAPATILIVMIMVVPLFYTLYCSFSNMDYMQFNGYVGLKNYIQILGDRNTWTSLLTTLVITFTGVAISLVFGTLLAIWVDRKHGIVAYGIELIGLTPWVISMVVAALLWKWVLDGDMGLFNYLRNLVGLDNVYVFLKKNYAVMTTIFVIAWRTIGYSMVMILAGLKSLPGEVLEAAQVDGANAFTTFWKIKLPMIKTPMLISSIVLTMSNFNNVTIPMVMTGGGPGTATNVISLMLYKTGFSYYQFGPASALSVLVFVINIVFVVIYVKAVKYEI